MANAAWSSDDAEVALAFKRNGPLLNMPVRILRLRWPTSFYVAKTGEIKGLIPRNIGTDPTTFGGDKRLRNVAIDRMRDRDEVCTICHMDILKNQILNIAVSTRFLKCGHV